jgi:two-component system invasion response regulator UvrY
MIRLAIAEDHEMVREGMERILADHSDLKFVVKVADGHALLAALSETEADVLLLDISMPGPGFLPVMDRIAKDHPGLAVLVVSTHSEPQWVVQALKAGAAGYLAKTHSSEELAEAIRRVHGGGRYITPAVAEILALRLGPRGEDPVVQTLSRRELEVLQKLAAGEMVKTVAKELGLSPKTVSTYRTRILEKLNLHSTADLIRFSVENDLIS